MSILNIARFRLRYLENTAKRGPTPSEVALFKRQEAGKKREREIAAAYESVNQ